jgi:hypothetical protein
VKQKQSRDEDVDFMDMMREIRDSDVADVDKVAQAFDHITGSIIATAEHEIELARALFDSETVVKQQVKMETMKSSREIFQNCCLLTLGRKVWDE